MKLSDIRKQALLYFHNLALIPVGVKPLVTVYRKLLITGNSVEKANIIVSLLHGVVEDRGVGGKFSDYFVVLCNSNRNTDAYVFLRYLQNEYGGVALDKLWSNQIRNYEQLSNLLFQQVNNHEKVVKLLNLA